MEKRVELHCHSKMSSMKGLCDLKELFSKAVKQGISGIAITDIDSVQAFGRIWFEINHLTGYNRSYIDWDGQDRSLTAYFGVEMGLTVGEMQEQMEAPALYRIIVLIKNETGIKNLFKLMTKGFENGSNGKAIVSKKLIEKYRKDLIIGCCAEDGEIVGAIMEGLPESEIRKCMAFYDFIEIEPPQNLCYPLNPEAKRLSMDEAEDVIKKTVAMGKELDIPVTASSNVYYIEKQDKEALRILRYATGEDNLGTWKACHHLMTSEELLAKFDFLGEDARDVVLENPARVVDGIAQIERIWPRVYHPVIEDATEELKETCRSKAMQIYGSALPEEVEKRLNDELYLIRKNGFSHIFVISSRLIAKSKRAGYEIGSEAYSGASLVAYLSGITFTNPLPPHYYCKKCGYSDFNLSGVKGLHIGTVGADLPDRNCPQCGEKLAKDGFGILAEILLGYHGDREPYISTQYATDYYEKALDELRKSEGVGSIYHLSDTEWLYEGEAFSYAETYFKARKIERKSDSIKKISGRLFRVKKSDMPHQDMMLVVPKDREITDVTPILKFEGRKYFMTHLGYTTMGTRSFLEVSIWKHRIPTILTLLKNDTCVDPSTIPLNDEKMMSLFSDIKGFGISPDQVGGTEDGMLGIWDPDEESYAHKITKKVLPKQFSDLIRIRGFISSTRAWKDNAELLLSVGKVDKNEVIANRDDILDYLMTKGMPREEAFKIMETTRKGRFNDSPFRDDWYNDMKECGVPEWYFDSLSRIGYLSARARSANLALVDWKLLYYKLYYPKQFYRRWLEVMAKTVDVEFVKRGYNYAKEKLLTLKSKNESDLDRDQRIMLEEIPIIMEMYARGINL